MFSSQKCVKIAKPYKNQINFFAYVVFYVKILVLVRILDEFSRANSEPTTGQTKRDETIILQIHLGNHK